tara:strand:+ start:60 stop:458 length:399 start_codon:yes stop_codon:yes gene_type:complete
MTEKILSESLSLEELDLLNDLSVSPYIFVGSWNDENMGDLDFSNYIFTRLEQFNLIEGDYFNEWSVLPPDMNQRINKYKKEYKEKPDYEIYTHGYKDLDFYDVAFRLTSIGKTVMKDGEFQLETFHNILNSY